ncbi:MAG: hypothetical protein K2W95_32275 [Candidatus Obscuribacterales bacterium]|nr:hypothetical protein [Candidatus Obscuribacterales bacterium]
MFLAKEVVVAASSMETGAVKDGAELDTLVYVRVVPCEEGVEVVEPEDA